MLPLWIIDLNKDQKARARLRERIEKLKVFDERLKIDDSDTFFYPKVDWCYTELPEVDYTADGWLEELIEHIVKAGQKYVAYLMSHSPSNECLANVVVLGDITQSDTLRLFSSLAAIIKNDKCRIIPAHVHQGISIVGFLYVPSNVNTLAYNKRQGVLRCLKELEIQGRLDRIKGYDRIVLYQDTQHRTQKFYPTLNEERLTEYLFQCLLNMYYACDASHPLLHGKNETDDYFISMGVGSLYYDTRGIGRGDILRAAKDFLKTLKADPTVESEDHGVKILDLDMNNSPESLIESLASVKHEDDNIDDVLSPKGIQIEEPNPHPVADYNHKYLKRYYYRLYLKLFPTRFINKLSERIAKTTSDVLIKINDKVDVAFSQISLSIQTGLKSVLKDKTSAERGCFKLVRKRFEDLKVTFIKARDERVDGLVEEHIWKPFILNNLPKRYRDYFTDYHDAFTMDRNAGNGTELCDEMKRNAMARLVALLQKEATILSRFGRSFILGMMLVLAGMPIFEIMNASSLDLSALSENHIEWVGDPKWYYFLVAAILFIIPSLIQLICYFIANYKKRKVESQLLTYYLHDSKARVANRIVSCVKDMYTDCSKLCQEYINRCDTILKESDIISEEAIDDDTMFVEKTMFNQPLTGGRLLFKYDDEAGEFRRKIFPENVNNLSFFSVNGGSPTRVDRLSTTQFYAIAHKDYSDILDLFKGVELKNRVTKDKDSETEELQLLTKEQIDKLKADAWEQAKKDFSHNIYRKFKEMQLPVGDPTIAEKVRTLLKNKMDADFEQFAKFCAPNGEFAINDDIIYADVKSNSHFSVQAAFEKYLPHDGRTDYQIDDKYKYMLFLTEWRAINEFALKRIVPELELDNKEFMFAPDVDITRFEVSKEQGGGLSYSELLDKEMPEFIKGIEGPISSILLYSLIGDSSDDWLELFSKAAFVRLDKVAEEKYVHTLKAKR